MAVVLAVAHRIVVDGFDVVAVFELLSFRPGNGGGSWHTVGRNDARDDKVAIVRSSVRENCRERQRV